MKTASLSSREALQATGTLSGTLKKHSLGRRLSHKKLAVKNTIDLRQDANGLYLVASSSSEGDHRVDAANCSCSCGDDNNRCAPKRRLDQPFKAWPDKERTICKHLTQIYLALGMRAAKDAEVSTTQTTQIQPKRILRHSW